MVVNALPVGICKHPARPRCGGHWRSFSRLPMLDCPPLMPKALGLNTRHSYGDLFAVTGTGSEGLIERGLLRTSGPTAVGNMLTQWRDFQLVPQSALSDLKCRNPGRACAALLFESGCTSFCSNSP